MATTQTTEIPPPPGPVYRRSRRLAGLPADLEVRDQFQTVGNIDYERRVLYDTKQDKAVRTYAERALNVKLENLHPGSIIKVIDAYPQTDLDARPFDPAVGRTIAAGPIGAKWRYMIVVWQTFSGVVAIPLYTLSEARVYGDRVNEFVSITTDEKWVGGTFWAGMPLIMRPNRAYGLEPQCCADLSRPHWVGKYEKIFDDVGRIDGGEYSKLMDLIVSKEDEYRNIAYARFNRKDDVELYEPEHMFEPKRGVRYTSKKTQRMAEKKFTRV